jgi:hypothetical protein
MLHSDFPVSVLGAILVGVREVSSSSSSSSASASHPKINSSPVVDASLGSTSKNRTTVSYYSYDHGGK